MKKTLKFKTNIKCMGCVSTVTPALDKAVGIDNWVVDTQSPHKELTVTVENQDADTILAALRETGYTAEIIEQAA